MIAKFEPLYCTYVHNSNLIPFPSQQLWKYKSQCAYYTFMCISSNLNRIFFNRVEKNR